MAAILPWGLASAIEMKASQEGWKPLFGETVEKTSLRARQAE
jgi:hypothetical protein